MNPATASRPEIREFVSAQEQEKAKALATGGNAEQVDLDQSDALHELIKDLGNEQKHRFLGIYTEEKSALINAQSEKQFAADLRKAQKPGNQQNKIGGVILIFVVIIGVLLLLNK